MRFFEGVAPGRWPREVSSSRGPTLAVRPSPRVVSEKEGHHIFRMPRVKLVHQAFSAPAHVITRLAGNAPFRSRLRAFFRLVVSCTIAALVDCGPALLGHMVPALTFHAAKWFLFQSCCMALFVADRDTVGYYSIGCFWVDE